MAGITETPNIGLQIPAFNQPNWQVPLNYDLNLLDLIFGGTVTVPALTVTTLTATNIGPSLLTGFVPETPTGAVPGSVYTLANAPSFILAFFINGIFQRPTIDYTLSGSVVTLAAPTVSGDNVYVLYFTA